eukprot:UN13425
MMANKLELNTTVQVCGQVTFYMLIKNLLLLRIT